MSAPDPKHVDAVARLLHLRMVIDPTDVVAMDDLALALLTSTDPAVLDALQDVLMRAGRLRGDFTLVWDGDPTMGGPQRQSAGIFTNIETARWALDKASYRNLKKNLHVEGRLVTEWKEG